MHGKLLLLVERIAMEERIRLSAREEYIFQGRT